MVSKYEVLEFLRINGGQARLADIDKTFGYPKHLRRVLKTLEAQSLVKREEIHVPGKKRPIIMYKLTRTAYKKLRKYNVESFYDHPGAQVARMYLRGRSDFIRFD